MPRSEYTDITVEIARAKAAAKHRGPWQSKCPLCGGCFPMGEEGKHREHCEPKSPLTVSEQKSTPFQQWQRGRKKNPKYPKRRKQKNKCVAEKEPVVEKYPNWDSLLGECVRLAGAMVGCLVSNDDGRELRVMSIETLPSKSELYANMQVNKPEGVKLKWKLKRVLLRIENQEVASYGYQLNKIFSRLVVMRSVWANQTLKDKTKLKHISEVQSIGEALNEMSKHPNFW